MKVEVRLDKEISVMETPNSHPAPKPDGPVVASIIAAGFGAFILGLFTTLAEASPAIKDFLNFYDPVGPLSGKTSLTVAVWLLGWGILHAGLRKSSVSLMTGVKIGAVLMILGLVGTFPPFFEYFTVE